MNIKANKTQVSLFLLVTSNILFTTINIRELFTGITGISLIIMHHLLLT